MEWSLDIILSQPGVIGNEEDWWQGNTLNEFKRRAQCVEDHYGEFVAYKNTTSGEEFKVKGDLTLAENIADIGGVLQSYYAYSK